MKRRFAISVCTILLLAASLPVPAAEVLDRIVATVNGRIILQSDWDTAIRYTALIDGRTMDQLSADDRKAALDRLIDQELLVEQMGSSDAQHASDDDVKQRLQEVRQQYPQARDEQAWHSVISQYGFSENELKQRIALQLELTRLVDVRLRPGVDIDLQTIESYYNQELLAQLRESGAKELPLAEASPKIRELLTEQKVNELLVAWLQNLRSGSDIQTEEPSSDSRNSR
ncbi:MAG: SurA N-terminal domain-containing protein [Acidobacteriaceae bacterium]|nr:SurA N-terminal domain-containing protein [Acidobacteriaceae bacterium]